jgi:hypothetical protein
MATKPLPPSGGEAREDGRRASHGRSKKMSVEREVAEREHNLDEALEETFPASDPVSIYIKSN